MTDLVIWAMIKCTKIAEKWAVVHVSGDRLGLIIPKNLEYSIFLKLLISWIEQELNH